MLLINDIVETISGEVSNFPTGSLVTLIRFQGCPLRCKYCDTPETISFDSETSSYDPIILAKNFSNEALLFLITGGEPLLQEQELITFIVNSHVKSKFIIETSGAIYVPNLKDYGVENEVSWVVDWKLSNSGSEHWMRIENIKHICSEDFIKFIISDEKTFKEALTFRENIANHKGLNSPRFAFSPEHGRIEVKTLFNWMKENNLYEDVLNVQMHKLLGLA